MDDTSDVLPDAISDIFINTRHSEEAFERIDDLVERGRERSFCRALLMFGPSRCGKTHMVLEWLRLRVAAKPGFRFVLTEVPAACTLNGMAAQLLEKMGDPDPDHGSQNEKTRRIGELGRGLDLVVIDEVQRLIDERTDRVRKDVANWLTDILNRCICPLLLLGEHHAQVVFQDNMYLRGRTLGQVSVDPYDWHDPAQREELREFLGLLDGELGMEELSGLSEPDTALRIHAFSDGRIGMATVLVDQARTLARRANRPRITTDLFAKVVDRLRVGDGRLLPNPFRVENPVIGGVAPERVRDPVPPAPARRGRQRA